MNDIKTDYHYIISVGVTWIDGRILFKRHTKYARFYYGICHYSKMIFAFTPLDYVRPLMIATIMVSHKEHFCERAGMCVNFTCPLNRFHKDIFAAAFKESGLFSLGTPQDFGNKPLWFNEGVYREKWKHFIIGVDGGVLRFNEESGVG